MAMHIPRVLDYIDDFLHALSVQLLSDEERHGHKWLTLPVIGQEGRICHRIGQYYNDWAFSNIPIPWLKVAGLAMIAWIRENYPEQVEEGRRLVQHQNR